MVWREISIAETNDKPVVSVLRLVHWLLLLKKGEGCVCTAVVVGVAGGGCHCDNEEVLLHLRFQREAGRECFDAWVVYALQIQGK